MLPCPPCGIWRDKPKVSGALLLLAASHIIDETRQPIRYAMSVISARVRSGPLDWLNRRIIIGTLQSARPDRQAVIIRAWEADASAEPT